MPLDNNDEASEIDIFLYGKSVSAEELILGLLNGDDEIISYGRLSFDEKIKAAFIHYLSECDRNPERVVFYAAKMMADETIGVEDAWEMFQSVSCTFPPVLVLLNLDKNDCKKLIELFPSPEKFKYFFNEYVITHPEVQKEIAYALRDPGFMRDSRLNWAEYYEPRKKIEQTLNH